MAFDYIVIKDSYGSQILAGKASSSVSLYSSDTEQRMYLNSDGVFGGVISVGTSITRYISGQTVVITATRASDTSATVSISITNSSLYNGGIYSESKTFSNVISTDFGKFLLLWEYFPNAGTFNGVSYGNLRLYGYSFSAGIGTFVGGPTYIRGLCLNGYTKIAGYYPVETPISTLFQQYGTVGLFMVSETREGPSIAGTTLTLGSNYSSTNPLELTVDDILRYYMSPVGNLTFRVPESDVRPYDPSKNISDATLNLAPTKFYYDGNEHTPAASLVDRNGYLLKNGVDYTVSYSADNINVGEKIALAIGIGEYIGEVQANWWILADNDISAFTIVIVPRQFEFDGESHEPLVTLYDNSGNLLTPNIDYTLTLGPDTVTVGEKYARCDGIGNYTGTIQGTWSIVDNINDPYSPGGTTVPSTGPTDGTWELPDDELAIPGSLFNDLATQLYRPYAMTAAQVASFSNQLWNTDVLDIISRYFEKPTEVVISLMSFPFTVECENSEQINFNWISSWSSVYVLGHPITKEIQTLDFGYLDLDRYSGLFYDYQPYSSVQLYLPYIGFVPLKMNEVVGKRILLSYKVDILSGDFTAIVETGDMIHPEEPERTIPIIGFYQGNIARPMPLSQQDLFSLFKKGTEIAITGAVAATAGTVGAIEGLAAERAVGDAVQFTEQGLPQAAQMAMGRAETSQVQSQSAYKTFKRFGAATVANSMLSIGNASAPILRNGTIDGISGRTSGQEAFIVITVPNQNVPDNQRILGYPTNQPGPLSKFSGYTEVRDIRLKIPNATESEIAEIESIVRGGIVI